MHQYIQQYAVSAAYAEPLGLFTPLWLILIAVLLTWASTKAVDRFRHRGGRPRYSIEARNRANLLTGTVFAALYTIAISAWWYGESTNQYAKAGQPQRDTRSQRLGPIVTDWPGMESR